MKVNIDVEDLEKATRFYCDGLGLSVGRRFDGWLELIGAAAPLYLLPKPQGTPATPMAKHKRDYDIALLADPCGNGFCLIEFTGGGYDEIVV